MLKRVRKNLKKKLNSYMLGFIKKLINGISKAIETVSAIDDKNVKKITTHRFLFLLSSK